MFNKVEKNFFLFSSPHHRHTERSSPSISFCMLEGEEKKMDYG